MRFSVITVAAAVCLIAGVQAAPAGAAGPDAAAGATPGPGAAAGGLDVTKAAGGLGSATGTLGGITSVAGGAGGTGVGKSVSGVVPGAPAIPVKRSTTPAAGKGATQGAPAREEAGTVQKATDPVAKLADKTAGKVTSSTGNNGKLQAAAPIRATVNGVESSALGDQQKKGVTESVTGGL
ncbi:hypothetical protein BJV82DRAFT_609770 [Fennellomyces sp. T-0311]|nr:hypothetical protein BJV82DRAFT_609770 [Fennellomyces sp. T-0311]